MLTKWYQGRECDVRQEQDVVRAAAKLAVLHLSLIHIYSEESADFVCGRFGRSGGKLRKRRS